MKELRAGCQTFAGIHMRAEFGGNVSEGGFQGLISGIDQPATFTSGARR